MDEMKSEPMSPAVKKVLDEYLSALHDDEEINTEAADRLDSLLRKGKAPKSDDIDAALFDSPKGDKP